MSQMQMFLVVDQKFIFYYPQDPEVRLYRATGTQSVHMERVSDDHCYSDLCFSINLSLS